MSYSRQTPTLHNYVYVCMFVHVQARTLSWALWLCSGFAKIFFVVVSVGVSNCDKPLGSAWPFVKPGVSLRNGAALKAA